MDYNEMSEAVSSAERTLRYADMAATKMAKMLVGRLRKVNAILYSGSDVLIALKKELRDFNCTTRKWK